MSQQSVPMFGDEAKSAQMILQPMFSGLKLNNHHTTVQQKYENLSPHLFEAKLVFLCFSQNEQSFEIIQRILAEIHPSKKSRINLYLSGTC